MKRTAAFILAIALVFGLLAGCDSGKPEEPAATPVPTPEEVKVAPEIGYWTLFKVDASDPQLSMDEEAVKMIKDLGMEIYIDLRAGGVGNFMLDSYAPVTWGGGLIKVADELEMKYSLSDDRLIIELEGDTYVFVRGEGEAPVPEAVEDPVAASPYSWWEGEWYGWWIVSSAWGSYEYMYDWFWDAYAKIEVYDDDTGRMLLWDMNSTMSEPMADVGIYFSYGAGENGALWAENGRFEDAEISHAEWVVDPDAMGFEIDDMFCFDFRYEDPNDPDSGYVASIYLRPWGTEWDDIEGVSEEEWPYDDMMPLHYADWYLPLVQQECGLPDGYQEGIDILSGATNIGTGEVLGYGIWDDCSIEVVGAEHFVDSNGKDAIRVYYDFTNTGTEDICAMNILSIEVTQDEYTQIETYPEYEKNVAESGNAYLTLRPGVTIRCVAEYSMKLSGGPLTMEFIDYWNDGVSFSVDFDPLDLPGRPPQTQWKQITDPKWLLNVSTEGRVGDAYVAFDHVEYVEDEYGNNAIRVYVSYTNESDSTSAFNWSAYYIAYQDGIELQSAWPGSENSVPEDDNLYKEIGPGQSLMAAMCFELRNEQSPVEFQIYDSWTGEVIGTVIELTWGG